MSLSCRVLLVVALALAIFCARPAGAAPLAVDSRDGPLMSRPDAEPMLERALRFGRLAVIIRMKTGFVGPPAAATSERNRLFSLKREQEAMIGRAAISSRSSIERFEFMPYVAAQLTAEELRRVLRDPAVAAVSEDVAMAPQLLESTSIVRARPMWKSGLKGTGQAIAILDSGIDADHETLAGRVVYEACFSGFLGSPFPAVSLCRNGRVQDSGSGAAGICPPEVTDCYHGTYVASIAAGGRWPAKGMAPDAGIIAIQIMNQYTTAAGCDPLPAPCVKTTVSNIARALQRVYGLKREHNIAAVNLSTGGGPLAGGLCDTSTAFKPVYDAVELLRNADIPVVAAAGNQGSDSLPFPACLSNVIAVGATNDTDDVWPSSNHSWNVKLMAPGVEITAAVPTGSPCITSGEYCTFSGTSGAAPHVAGALALLREADPAARIPKLLSSLYCSGKPVERFEIFRPRINILRASGALFDPDLAFDYQFDTQADADAFTSYAGTWARSGTRLKLSSWNSGAEWVVTGTDYCSPSFVAQATVERRDAGGDGFNGRVGLLVASDLSTINGHVYASGFLISVGLDGTRVERLDNYHLKPGSAPSGGSTVKCMNALIGGFTHPATIAARVLPGGRLDVFVDGQLVCGFYDRTHPPPAKIAVAASHVLTFEDDDVLLRRLVITPIP